MAEDHKIDGGRARPERTGHSILAGRGLSGLLFDSGDHADRGNRRPRQTRLNNLNGLCVDSRLRGGRADKDYVHKKTRLAFLDASCRLRCFA